MKYDVWTRANGDRVRVVDMADLHLLHTIRAIEEGRTLGSVRVYSTSPPENYDVPHPERDNWLTVLKGEALKRGLDWSQPPTRKVSLFEAVRRFAVYGEGVARNFEKACRDLGFEPPTVDVCNKTGKVTYLHWVAGKNVGTPISGT